MSFLKVSNNGLANRFSKLYGNSIDQISRAIDEI